MLKKDLEILVNKQAEELEELRKQLADTEPTQDALNEANAKLAELEKELERLKEENARLREYCEMANQESATMSLEIDRVKRKMNEVFEDNLHLVKAIESVHHMATRNLNNSMTEELKIKEKGRM